MSANVQFQLIGKIIEKQDLHSAMKLKVTEDFFDDICKQVFGYLLYHFHHQNTYGLVPSWDIIRYYFPNFHYIPTYDEIPTLCEQVRLARMRQQLIALGQDIQELADKDPRAALELMKTRTSLVASDHETTEEYYLSQSSRLLRNEYDLVASGCGITGIPWPWQQLNEDTRGLQKGELVVIYGRPKSMKTWIALYTAGLAYYDHGARVLILSNEMHPKAILRRLAAVITKIDYKKLIEGKLNPADRDRYFMVLESLEVMEHESKGAASGHYPSILVMGKQYTKHGGGVASLQAKIRDFEPDLVVVDGIYLLNDDLSKKKTVDWQVISNISRALKETCNQFNLPLIGVTQASRKADKDDADLDEIAYADAIGQDCDLAMRVGRVKNDNGEWELRFLFPGSRESDMEGFVTNAQPAINFAFKYPYTPAQKQKPAAGGSSPKPKVGGGGSKQQQQHNLLPHPNFGSYRASP